jgi:membrane protease YdiL (CAAX protease family)
VDAAPPEPAPPGENRSGSASGTHGLHPGWRLLLWVAFLLVFAALLAVLVQPWAGGSPLASFVVLVAAPTFAGWAVLALQGKRPGALGWTLDADGLRAGAVGFALGAVLIVAAVGILAVAGSVRWVAEGGSGAEYAAALARSLGFFLVAAAAEETLFRGYGFQALVEAVGPWGGTAAASLAFAAVHSGNPAFGAVGFANIFVAGVLLSVVYLRTRSLWAATGVHLGWNWAMAALHFPVSGLGQAMPLYAVREHGAGWWTGGAFGPEAGLPATLVLLAGIAWALRTRRLRESPRMRARAPLVDARLGPEWPR